MAKMYTRDLRVQALLRGSNSPTSRSPEAVDWIMRVWVTGVRTLHTEEGGGLYRVRRSSPALSNAGFKVYLRLGVTGNAPDKVP